MSEPVESFSEYLANKLGPMHTCQGDLICWTSPVDKIVYKGTTKEECKGCAFDEQKPKPS